jgi:integrase
VREYRRAVEQLQGKGTLNDAVRFFKANAHPDLPAKTVGEVSLELLAAKEADKLSERYQRDLRGRLATFAKAFTGQIIEIKTPQIEAWLRGLKTGVKNRNNYANAITTLFRFAKRVGYLAPDRVTAADSLTRAKYTGGEIEIYTPTELGAMLTRLRDHRPELLPFVAIGAFAGVRTAELVRLPWASVNFEQGFIEVSAGNAKTAQRRHIPIQPNLAAWLQVETESLRFG